MKFYNCPNCDSRFPVRPVECPSCGESIVMSEWKEVEVDAPPMPTSPILVELHGDLGRPFVYRKQVRSMGVGRPSLTNVSSHANCCEREQFVLSWEGERCFISTPGTPPRNTPGSYPPKAPAPGRTAQLPGSASPEPSSPHRLSWGYSPNPQ